MHSQFGYSQKTKSDEFVNQHNLNQKPKYKYPYSKKKHIRKNTRNWSKSNLDFHAIYIKKIFSSTHKDSVYSFIRFFPKGEVFYSYGYYHEPSVEEANDLTYGRWKMYKIKKNGEIIIETPAYGELFVYWYHYFAKINVNNNSLIIYKYRLGRFFSGAIRKKNIIYYRRKFFTDDDESIMLNLNNTFQ